jgi:hypothetical protein
MCCTANEPPPSNDAQQQMGAAQAQADDINSTFNAEITK